jgi:glycosyltransferase involved in cell wall biosynthesis
MANPTLSVLLTSYNYSQYIGEALDALLAQSYKPKEIIVVDDASTDNSAQIIKDLINKYPDSNIVFLQNEKNMGGHYSVTKAMGLATGDYVYSAAADDKVLPGFFEKSMNVLIKYPQAGLSCSDVVIFFPDGRSLERVQNYSDVPRYFSPNEALKLFLKSNTGAIRSHSVILKRAALIEAGGYMKALKWHSDLFATNVICFRHGICYIPEILTSIRAHPARYGKQNAKQNHLDRDLIKNMFDLYRSPKYGDVLPMIKRATAFSKYPWEVLRVVLGDRKYWGFLSAKLLRLTVIKGIIMMRAGNLYLLLALLSAFSALFIRSLVSAPALEFSVLMLALSFVLVALYTKLFNK